MQALQQKALEWSGVSLKDAFAVDDTNLFEVLGGRQPFVDLITNFYTRIFDDQDEWFRMIFDDLDESMKEIGIQNQADFLVQRFGGPSLFSKGRGHTSLIPRHRPFPITHRAAERWLHHMQLALDDTGSIDPDSRVKMMNYLRYTAYFIVAGKEMAMEGNEFPCEHATRNPAA